VSLLLLLFVLAVQDSTAVSAVQPQRDVALEAATRAVASELRCVVCQGLSIEDSPSELARSMRAVVRDQLAEGRTPDEVKAYFVSRYGEWVLLRPQARGFNLTVYLLPVAMLLGGALFLMVVIRRWARQPVTAEALDSALHEEPELAPWDEVAPRS
jgi:cytochrome c-type biogenesis protein CcmH